MCRYCIASTGLCLALLASMVGALLIPKASPDDARARDENGHRVMQEGLRWKAVEDLEERVLYLEQREACRDSDGLAEMPDLVPAGCR